MRYASQQFLVQLGLLLAALLLALSFSFGVTANPAVVHHAPAQGEELRLDGIIEIQFNQPMDPQSIQKAWSIEPSAEGTLSWLTPSILHFRPDVPWTRDTEYRLYLSTTARTYDGQPLDDPFDLILRTVGYLEATQRLPADGATEIAADTPIFVAFNRPVVPLMTLSDPHAADLPQPLSFTPEISGTGEWLNTSIYVFTPDAPLTGGTTYTVTLRAGLSDTTGGILASDVVWRFFTERPKLVWHSPSSNSRLVPIETSIEFTFNMPVDLNTVRERFELRTTGILGGLFSELIPGEWTSDGETVVFQPDVPLDFDRSYRLTLAPGVTGRSGGLGMEESISSTFRTVPLPRILSTDPLHGESDAYPYTSFVITFNTPINPDTVLDHVSISPEPDPEEISGYYRSWDRSYVIRFGAGPSQSYEVEIASGIEDPYGNRTDQPMTVRFSTRALEPSAWLHVPGQVGTFSTYEPATMVVAHRNTDSITLTLSRLTMEDYFDATSDWYRYAPSRESQLRRWTVPVSGKLDAVAYTPVELLSDASRLEPGIYMVELEARGVDWNRWQHRHLLIASPINLTLKTSADETLVWACDLSSGEPIPGLILRAYDGDGDPVEATITDRDGVATFAGADAVDWRGLTIRSLTPFALGTSEWSDGISIWDFGYRAEGATDRRLFLDTDRPIYRPGQAVHFRGVLRDEIDARYSVPNEGKVQLEIRDSQWNLIHSESYALDEFGAFDGTLQLDDDAFIGTYRFEASTEGMYFTESFEVAAYRAPEFKVTVQPQADELVSGDAIQAMVEVDYFFGAPVADQTVEWDLYVDAFHFSPSHLGRYTFSDRDDPWICWTCWWLPPSTPTPVLDGSGITNNDGNLLIAIPYDALQDALADDVTGSLSLTLEATARGADGQVISGRRQITVHAAELYAGLSVPSSIARAGEPAAVDVVTVDWSGARVAAQQLTYHVFRREWNNIYEEDASGSGHWTWTVDDIEVETGTLTTDGVGVGRFSVTPPEGGTYKVQITGTDAEGRQTRSSLFLWVTGPETVSWRRSNDDRITLISDKTQYEVGDIARLLIPSPYANPHWALITVERAGVLYREVRRLETNSDVYELPITQDHIPNIYVSVVVFQGLDAALAAADGAGVAESKVGYAALDVSPAPKALHIELLPSNHRPLPGNEVAYEIRVTDDYGNPVQTALAFDLVDAAVLTLRPRTANAIMDAFYGQRGLGVSTASGLSISINRLVVEQLDDLADGDEEKFAADENMSGSAAPQAVMAEAADASAEPGTALRSAVAQQLPEGITIREDFEDTAHWSGDVITDADGRTTIAIELPDNLTTWTARAVGITLDTEVGEGTADLLVTKPLLIRPVTPRFLVVGDRGRLLANISNQTDQDLEAEVTLAQSGLALEDEAVRTVHLPAQGEIAVEWWGIAQDVDAADLAFSVVSGELSDAARPRLTTGPDGALRVFKYTSPEIVGTSGQLTEPGSRTEIVMLPPQLDDTRSELILRLETSLAAAMQEGLAYLEHFKYECTEQVISRFLPNVLTARALQDVGIENPELAERLPELVAQGLEKLVVRQHGDGGWGWWTEDDSSPYLTAYAIYALIEASRSGYDVPGDVLERGVDFLERHVTDSTDLTSVRDANRQAWLTYVLAEAGRTDTALRAAERLFENRAKMSHYAKAWLALTLDLGNGESLLIDTLVSDLYGAAILSSTGMHWEEAQFDRWAMNTDTRSTAIILDALVRIDPTQPNLPSVVRWLMVARKGGIWETTQETAWALIALTDWMVATGEFSPAYSFSTVLNGNEILEGQTDGTALLQPIEWTTGTDQLLSDGGNTLTFRRGEGDGSLYYTAHLLSHLPVKEIEALNRGIILQRQYLSPACDEDEPCPDLDTVAEGDEIQVLLTLIAPHDLYYVVVEDPFPAGCEAIDPSLATTSLSAEGPRLDRSSDDAWNRIFWWWWRWYSHSEFRDEKVVLFAEYLPAGTYTFQYALRAVTPGEFGVLPTFATEFYFPEVFGRSDGRTLIIESRGD